MRSNVAEFFACDGVPRNYGSIEMQCVDDGQHIFPQPAGAIVRHIGFRRAENPTATASDAIDVAVGRELRREIIEDVSRIW